MRLWNKVRIIDASVLIVYIIRLVLWHHIINLGVYMVFMMLCISLSSYIRKVWVILIESSSSIKSLISWHLLSQRFLILKRSRDISDLFLQWWRASCTNVLRSIRQLISWSFGSLHLRRPIRHAMDWRALLSWEKPVSLYDRRQDTPFRELTERFTKHTIVFSPDFTFGQHSL